IDHGAFLAATTAAGSGTSVTVTDGRYFSDGYGITEGDLIMIGTRTVRITHVSGNTLTLDQNITWSAGDHVSYPYAGSAPDIGALEYASTPGATLQVAVSGSGSVNSNDGYINCPSGSCSHTYSPPGATVTLTAQPQAGASFTSWSGACTGTSTTCTLTMDSDKAATATFTSNS